MTTTSILIPVHNCETHIAQAVESALAQNPAEVIVYSDACTDGTLDILTRYPIGIIHGQQRLGAQYARNMLVLAAKGEYLAFLDADDYFLPGKLATQVLAMQEAGAVASYSNFQVEKYLNRNYDSTYEVNTATHNLLLSLLRYEFNPITGCWVFHRDVFHTLRFDETSRYKYGHQDRKLALDLFSLGFNPIHVNHPGLVHRCGWSGAQISSSGEHLIARQNFLFDLFAWVSGIENQTWARYYNEESQARSC